MSNFHYTVRGRWPFPVDMLRYDNSVAETPRDQALIDRLSEEFAPDQSAISDEVEIKLVIRGAGRWRPNTKRWESFGWSVPSDKYRSLEKLAEQQDRVRLTLVQSALAKLTAEEIRALEWFGLNHAAINAASTKS